MNQLEYEALEDEYLSHEARSLYVMCLRRYMDFSTGLVGTKRRRVCYQQFREHLSVSRPRRSSKPPFIPSLQQVRGCVVELERVGLVQRLPKKGKYDYMIFFLPLATSDLARLNEEQQQSNKEQQQKEQQAQQQEEQQAEQQAEQQVEQQSQAPIEQGLEPEQQQAGQQVEQQEQQQEHQQAEQQEEQQQSNKEEQHTSVTSVSKENIYINAHEENADEHDVFSQPYTARVISLNQSGSRKFPMSYDWQPDQATFADQAMLLGVDLSKLDSDQREQIQQALEEFRTYWVESRPHQAETQRLWQQYFINNNLKRVLSGTKGQNNNTGAPHGKRHQQNRSQHSGSPTTRPYAEQDFDLDASF